MNQKTIAGTVFFIALTFSFAAFAFTPPPQPTDFATDVTIDEVVGIVLGIFWSVVTAFIIIAFILSIFLAATSGGDPGKTGQARQAAIWGIVGIAVVLLSYVIVSIVKNTLAF